MYAHTIRLQDIQAYRQYLICEEKASSTTEKYIRDLLVFYQLHCTTPIDKEVVIRYKTSLMKRYAPASVNSILASINGFLVYMGWAECRVKPLRIQKDPYGKQEKVLSYQEYLRLLEAARKKQDQRLYCLLQTLCATGIRISELPGITAECLQEGKARIYSKGKYRVVFLPKTLCVLLRSYCAGKKIQSGSIFVTRSGRPLNRSNIWMMMKKLCLLADVAAGKVFPHNLRHLFARTFYKTEKDLDHLASILGHSNINTTRIYTQANAEDPRRQIERLHLVL